MHGRFTAAYLHFSTRSYNTLRFKCHSCLVSSALQACSQQRATVPYSLVADCHFEFVCLGS